MGFVNSLSLHVVLLDILLSFALATQCYYPDGTKSNDVPCSSGSDPTWCCSQKSACLNNGLCLNLVQPYQLSRGNCTDKSQFGSAADGSPCPDYCASEQPSSGAAIVPFISNDTHSTYCCNSVVADHDQLYCSKPDSSVLSPPVPWEIYMTGAIIPGFAALSSLGSDGNTSPYIQNFSGSSSSSDSATSSRKDDSNKNVAIGAGVGVPLGVLLVMAIAWAVVERRKRQHLAAHAMDPNAVYPSERNLQPLRNSYAENHHKDIAMSELSSGRASAGPAELYEPSRYGTDGH